MCLGQGRNRITEVKGAGLTNYDGVILDSLSAWDTQFWPLSQEQEMPRAARRQEPLFENRLFFGDNLRIMRNRAYVERESVDLVYLDPPFKPTEKYNVLFRARGGTPAAAQVRAFEDTWHWSDAAAEAFHDTKENAPPHVARTLEAMRTVLNESDMFAYLCMMAPRLVELHKVLKPTGSIYLHCDPAASHYLKVLMDAIFDPGHFRNEIIWKRANAHNDPKRFGSVSDTILYYSKGDQPTWNPQHTKYREDYYKSHFQRDADGRWYRTVPLDAPRHGKGSPALLYEWHGKMPASTRTWAVRRALMEKYEAQSRLRYTRTGTPTLLQYADEMPGVLLQNIWTDIPPVNPQARERLGYPTQKPLPLLERIIQASTNPGDVVLDPFCGCGTTVDAAQGLHRFWIGIDIAYDAIRIIRGRLGADAEYQVYGDPESAEDAETLARHDPYQFQWWAVRRLGAHEVDQKKGADKGIDGRLILRSDKFTEAIISVKAGQTGPAHVRELSGTLEREKALFGVLVTLKQPTKSMLAAAADAGGYADGWRWYPKIQLITAADIIEGRQVEYPVETGALAPADTPQELVEPQMRSAVFRAGSPEK